MFNTTRIFLTSLLLGSTFLVQAQEPMNHQDDDEQECLPDQGKEPGDCFPDQGKDPGEGQGKEPGQGQDSGQGFSGFRVDCRYHSTPEMTGIRFCVASILYRVEGKALADLKMGVGCDYNILFSGPAALESQTISDRVMPRGSIMPAVEMPTGALWTPGTYQSILDVFPGQLSGTCFVKEIDYGDLLLETS